MSSSEFIEITPPHQTPTPLESSRWDVPVNDRANAVDGVIPLMPPLVLPFSDDLPVIEEIPASPLATPVSAAPPHPERHSPVEIQHSIVPQIAPSISIPAAPTPDAPISDPEPMLAEQPPAQVIIKQPVLYPSTPVEYIQQHTEVPSVQPETVQLEPTTPMEIRPQPVYQPIIEVTHVEHIIVEHPVASGVETLITVERHIESPSPIITSEVVPELRLEPVAEPQPLDDHPPSQVIPESVSASIHIGALEIHVVPVPPTTQTQQTQSASKPRSLSRGFYSSFGLRQG
jgi:hypothetical protein